MNIAKCRLATATRRPGPSGALTNHQLHPLPHDTLQAQGRSVQVASRKGLSKLSKLSTWCARPRSRNFSISVCPVSTTLFYFLRELWIYVQSFLCLREIKLLSQGRVPHLYIAACAQKERWGQGWFYLSGLSSKHKKILGICTQSLG